MRAGFWWGDLRDCNHLEDPDVREKIMLKLLFKMWDGGMDWTDLFQDSNRWLAFLIEVMNLRFPRNSWNFVRS